MTPTLKAMVEAMAAEVRRQADDADGNRGGVIYETGSGEYTIDARGISLEKVAGAGLEALWRPPESLPPAPTEDTWRILAYCPQARAKVRELHRSQDYEGGPWHWTTPHGASGRGNLVLPEAIFAWQALPKPPASDEALHATREG